MVDEVTAAGKASHAVYGNNGSGYFRVIHTVCPRMNSPNANKTLENAYNAVFVQFFALTQKQEESANPIALNLRLCAISAGIFSDGIDSADMANRTAGAINAAYAIPGWFLAHTCTRIGHDLV